MANNNNNCNCCNCEQHHCEDRVCVDVSRVYDSCRDRDCMTDLRIYVDAHSQQVINNAVSVKPISAEIIWSYIDVEALPFNRGFYTVDIRYFFLTQFDVYTGIGRPTRVAGLATADKKVILFGSEGGASIFSSLYVPSADDIALGRRTNLPKATVEVVTPLILDAKIVEPKCNCGCGCCDITSVPAAVKAAFSGDLVDPEDGNRLFATIGVFSIVRLMRDVQIIVPSFDFCIPEKECCGPDENDPCSLFYRMEFPQDEFFPPAATACDVSPCTSCNSQT